MIFQICLKDAFECLCSLGLLEMCAGRAAATNNLWTPSTFAHWRFADNADGIFAVYLFSCNFGLMTKKIVIRKCLDFFWNLWEIILFPTAAANVFGPVAGHRRQPPKLTGAPWPTQWCWRTALRRTIQVVNALMGFCNSVATFYFDQRIVSGW